VGRINRINKKVFDELFIYNFFPTATGEEQVRIKQVVTLKKTMINYILGEDTKVLTPDEELNSFYKEQYRTAERSQEEKSWDVEYLNFINSLKSGRKDIIEEALNIQLRTRIRRTTKKEKTGVIIFGKKGYEYTFKLGRSPKEIVTLTTEDAIKIFEAEPYEKPESVSQEFEKIYQNLKNNLFTSKTEFTKDKGIRDAVDKINLLKDVTPALTSYLEDLLYVLEKLDNLPERFSRLIRAINEKSLQEDLETLQQEVPHDYLISIINKASSISKGEEYLILSEELI